MKQFSVILIGAGDRGTTYIKHMHDMPEKYNVIGVAEPIEARRNYVKDLFNLKEENCFKDWKDILSIPKFADIAIIATMDDMHYSPAMKAIELGYDLLLEKPAAQSAKQCADIANAAKEKGVSVLVCHVLRYSPFFKKVKSIIDSDMIGDVITINHVEAVGHLHQSHSYVRGNWHSEQETTPMLIAKSCHDIDILQWLLGKRCRKVQSFGDLVHFRPENAPKGAPVRCADGTCPNKDTCYYNCIKLYYDDKNNMWFRKASTKGIAKQEIPTDEEVMEALKTTDYGLCVYQANNDVVDNQVVNMQFDGGVTVNFNMNCFNKGGRFIRVFGTKGELTAYMSDKEISVFTFEDRKVHKVPVAETEESILGGHGGGDKGIVVDMYDYLCGTYDGCSVADISISASNHLIGYAAERSRHTDCVIMLDDYFEEFGMINED